MRADEDSDNETLEQWHKDPSNWILGIFYFNRKDKRILPPKRLPYLGWTINFANPLSISVLIGIIILALLMAKIGR